MTSVLKILLVEDREDDAELVRRTLTRGGLEVDIERVVTLDSFRKTLSASVWDAVICDFTLPDTDGLAVLEALRASGLDLPFIVVSGVIDEEVAVEVMRAGAHDYVMKDNLVRLVPAVQRELAEAARRKAGRRAEIALDAQERLLVSVFDSLQEGITVLDCDLRVATMNPAMERMLGLGAWEGEGTTCKNVVPGCDLGCEDCVVGEAQRTRSVAFKQVRQRDAGGVTVEACDVSCVPRADVGGGEIDGYIVVVRDVIDQVRLQERLTRAEKLEALGHFAAGIAHDFNNLVMIILGAVELMRPRVERAGVGPDLEVIERAGRGATDLVRSLLAFARRGLLRTEEFDLDEVVAQTLSMVRRMVPREIRIDLLPGRRSGTVRADRSRLQQVLLNLCLNSRDAIEGSGEIVVETGVRVLGADFVADRPWATTGEFVFFSVTDNGCGMDERTLAQVFDPFFTTKHPDRGTGLGLASVYGIVKQHGGVVDVVSKPGLGTTFRVFLPRVAAPVLEPESMVTPVGRSAPGTVLVVDDCDDLRSIVARFVEGLGHRASEAANGEEALSLITRGLRPDIVVTDISMPRMGGLELFERSRALIPKARFVFCSGLGARADGSELRHLGPGTVWVEKPFDITTLEAAMGRLLQIPTAGGAAPEAQRGDDRD